MKNKRPRIFVAIHYLELGGAETSLIGLLHAFDSDKVDVDLFVYSHQGNLMTAIPRHVNLLPENKTWSMLEKPLKQVLQDGHLRIFLARLKAKRLMKCYLREHNSLDGSAIFGFIGQEVNKVLPDINPSIKYDMAISYLHPHHFVRSHIRAKKYLCWIHTDYSAIDVNAEMELPIWGAYEHIVSISPDCTKGFLSKFPSLKLKILEMENIMPKALIEQKVKDNLSCSSEFKVEEGVTRLVSVGRICEAKNYDNIPYMVQALKRLCISSIGSSSSKGFHWYIIGPGDHSAIDKLSEQLGVSDAVTFLGSSSNPYPYIQACDIYVHPSRYEGKSIVVREAQILCKPVIITNYPTAKSQIQDGVDGVICELDNQKIAEAIYELANNQEKQQTFIDYLRTHDYAGMREVEKLYDLLITEK